MDIDKLLQNLKDNDDIVKINAVEELSKINSIEAINPLISTLGDTNSEVRYAVVKALGNFQDKRVLNILVKALKDTSWYVRVQAGINLEKILKDKNQSSILDFLFVNDPEKLSKLYSAAGLIMMNKDIEKKYLKFILDLIDDEDKNIRMNAITILGDLQNNTVVDNIIEKFKQENDEQVREVIIHSLKNFNLKKVEYWFIDQIKDQNPIIRSLSIQILGDMDSNNAIPRIIEALNDEDSYVRCSAAVTLGNLRKEEAIQPLLSKLKDSDSNVVYYVKSALEKIGI